MQQKRSQNSGRIIDMKHYTVEITNEALADMEQLYNHIAYVLQAPENAMDQYKVLPQLSVKQLKYLHLNAKIMVLIISWRK